MTLGINREDAFKQILGKVGIGAVLIGHEKSAGRASKRDVSSLGMELADQILLTEFIDAVEISDRNAEIQIRKFVKNYRRPDVPFVLGSDCHNWAVYPLHDSREESLRVSRKAFSSIKALPTFEGLVMAITDASRIKVGDCSFFARNSASINKLDVTVGGVPYTIPMSPGINVIIGDNSIGKSMLLHSLTEFRELDSKRDKSLITGYKGYCTREGLEIHTSIPSFTFDSQQSVRRKLEGLHDGTADGPFEKYYHKRVDVEVVRQILRSFFQEGLDALESKLAYNDKLANLKSLDLVDLSKPPVSKRATISKKVSVPSLRGVNALISDLDLEIGQLKSLQNKHAAVVRKVGRPFSQEVQAAIAHLDKARELASAFRDQESWHIAKVNALNQSAAKENKLLLGRKTDEEKDFDAFSISLENASAILSELTSLRWGEVNRSFSAPQVGDSFEDNPMGEFHFVSELNTKIFDEEYRDRLLERAFLKSKVPSIVEGIEGPTTLTTSELIAYISNGDPKPAEWKAFVMGRLEDGIQEVRERPKITNTEIGLDSEPSAGLYGQIYFELIGQDDDQTGVYIIDQPEDQISQRAIRKHVLSSFKRMAETRQVILVTHNPQFVVNLDADNVIALDRDDESGFIRIRSGALEYECEEYSILDVVANMVEGGADVVRKRLKRYGGQLRTDGCDDDKDSYV